MFHACVFLCGDFFVCPGRSEDVDPLLKELFSETKELPAKDRRDDQKSGDSDPGSDDDTEQMSQAVNKTSSLNSQGKQDDDSDEMPKDSDGPGDESENQASMSPKDDKPSDKSPDSQAKDDGMQESEDGKDDDSNIMKSDSDSSGDSELLSSGAGESVKKDKSSSVSSDEKSPELPGKESTVASPELAKVNDKSAKPGDKRPDVTAGKDQSDHASDVASASVHSQTPDVTAEKDQSDHASDVASASVHPETPDVTAEKDQSNLAPDVASASVDPQMPDVTTAKDQSDHSSETTSVNPPPVAASVHTEKQQPTVSGNRGAEINSDTSQSMNYPNTMENTKSNIPETATNSDVLPNIVRQSSNNGKIKNIFHFKLHVTTVVRKPE